MRRTHEKAGDSLLGKDAPAAQERDCSPEFLAEAFTVLEGRWKLSILHNLFGPEGTTPPARREDPSGGSLCLVSATKRRS